MVVGICITLSMTNYTQAAGGGLSFSAIAIGVLDAFLLLRCKIGIPWVILLSAVLGLLLYGVVPMLTS